MWKLLRWAVESQTPRATVLVRLLVGAVFLSEGIQKFLFVDELGVGRFAKIGIPWPQFSAPFVGVVETVCGAALIAGLLTRLAAIPLIIDIAVAIASTKVSMLLHDGFWKMAHEARTDLCMFLGGIFLLIVGAGPLSLDRWIARALGQRGRRAKLVMLGIVALLCLPGSKAALAGPPFITDDPEPVDLHHWEVYIASQRSNTPTGRSGTLPHIEVNYGAAPNLQLHTIVPYAYSRAGGGPMERGLGDIELGVKYRFIQETDRRPMVGIFPLLEVPSGNADKGLGSGHAMLFFPVWVQKSRGSWTTYGGGGYWINPGAGNRDYWFTGWLVQKDLNERWTLGAEVYRTTSTDVTSEGQVFTNVGGQFNIDDGHHILFSLGRSIHGDSGTAAYIAHQWTFGPREEPAPAAVLSPPGKPPSAGPTATSP